VLLTALVLTTNAFGQQKFEPSPRDTDSDLLWKKLKTLFRNAQQDLGIWMHIATSRKPVGQTR
jgi:hypothetical protein